jgi:hypothetical protein
MRHTNFRSFILPLSGFIVFATVLSCYLVGVSSSQSYYREVTVIFPLLLLFHDAVFRFASFALLILLGTLMWIIGKNKSIKIYAVVLMTLTVILASAILWQNFISPNEEFRDRTEFQGSLYYLTVIFGYVLGHDCDITAYVIYKCDSLGLICKSYNTPYLDSYPDTRCSGNLTKSETTNFIVDSVSNDLFVQIGNKKLRVEAKY